MSKAKDIMHWGAECVAASDTLETAARMMRDGHVGSLPLSASCFCAISRRSAWC